MKQKIAPLAFAVVSAMFAGSASAEWGTHGYARASAGANVDGGGQICYGNGGKGSNRVGRLGDECDTYLEIGAHNYDMWSNDDAKFGIVATASFRTTETGDPYEQVNGQGNSWQQVSSGDGPWDSLAWALREFWGSAEMEDYTLWMGKRFYKRQDIHILDFFYLDGSSYGAGVENISALGGKTAFALRTGFVDDLGSNCDKSYVISDGKIDTQCTDPLVEDQGVNGDSFFQTITLDWALEDVKLSDNNALDFRVIYSFDNASTGQDKNHAVNENTGALLHGQWTMNHSKGFNKVGLQLGTDGYSQEMGSFLGYSGQNFDHDNVFEGIGGRVFSHGVVDVSDKIAVGYSVMAGSYDVTNEKYNKTENGISYVELDEDSEGVFFDVAARAHYFWSDIMSTVVEAGFYSDSTDTTPKGEVTSTDGNDLGKITIAQQWQAGKGFWNRPALRLFVTHYMGSVVDDREDAEKAAGRDNKASTTVGAHMEVWW